MPGEVARPVEFDLEALTTKAPDRGGEAPAVVMPSGEGFNLRYVQDAINGTRGVFEANATGGGPCYFRGVDMPEGWKAVVMPMRY